MKKKLPIIMIVCAICMLAVSTFSSTRATLTYISENYLAQIDLKSIGVTLQENGQEVSWRDYQHRDDSWSEATGVLLSNMLSDAGDENLVLGKEYKEELAVKNSGTIDQYVRVTVTHYWVDKDGQTKRVDLDPSLININFTNNGWIEDTSSKTAERNVFYYSSILKSGETSSLFADKISISDEISKKVIKTTESEENGVTTITTEYTYEDASFVLEAKVDAVQTHNAEEAIKSAWGVDVSISDGSLSLK